MQRKSVSPRFAHLIGKTLQWTEVGDGFEEVLSSPILAVHYSGKMFFVDEHDEPRWITSSTYVKNIRIVEIVRAGHSRPGRIKR